MSRPSSADLTNINSLFRPMDQYVHVLADILEIFHKRNFKPHDLHVIAGGIGFVSNQGIRKSYAIPEYADNVVRIAVQQGINAMRIIERLAQEGKSVKD